MLACDLINGAPGCGKPDGLIGRLVDDVTLLDDVDRAARAVWGGEFPQNAGDINWTTSPFPSTSGSGSAS